MTFKRAMVLVLASGLLVSCGAKTGLTVPDVPMDAPVLMDVPDSPDAPPVTMTTVSLNNMVDLLTAAVWPPSRPTPDCLTPPNGAPAFETMPWLRPIIPVSRRSQTRIARFRSLV